jgi:DNA-binding winged helix-turn-helix (wHTH) protein
MESYETLPVVVGQSEAIKGRRWAVTERGLTLGREEGCEILIQDRQVSRRHARISRTSDGVTLTDLDSKNGTCVNGTPLKGEIVLRDGDKIQIALAAELMFIASDSTLPLEMETKLPRPGRIRLNPVDHSVFLGDQPISPALSIHQYRLLELLILRGGALVTREDLVQTVWPDEESGGITDQAIDALVRRLRDRLKEIDPDREFLVTVRGHGFRLDNSV